jgi:hypothetical protein
VLRWLYLAHILGRSLRGPNEAIALAIDGVFLKGTFDLVFVFGGF